jgi:D-amino-acid dehydrogenase
VAKGVRCAAIRDETFMKICILGAGIIGLTTAKALADDGHEVTIIDQHSHAGMGASAANGGQLSYSFVTPLASPETLRNLPALLISADAPVRFRPGLDRHFIAWCVAFLQACNSRAVAATITTQLGLAALSRVEMDACVREAKLDFGRRTTGKLVLYRSARAFRNARAKIASQQGNLTRPEILSPSECLALEPALQVGRGAFAGGAFTASEEVGDCALFCAGLVEHLGRCSSVTVVLNAVVSRPHVFGNRLAAIETSVGRIEADAFVLCMGTGSVPFAYQCGIQLPIYPLKGHSLTYAATPKGKELSCSVTDFDRRIVFAPLGQAGQRFVRVAGVADLTGHDVAVVPDRIKVLSRAAYTALGLQPADATQLWCGLRPQTPDSRPIICHSSLDGLLLNCGHGMLGWTLACGSARVLADVVSGRKPPVNPTPFDARRFS